MINIVGAGPCGLYAATSLAKAGKRVRVYEEHREIGSPVQCTGIVTSDIRRYISLKKDVIVNRIRKAEINSKSDKAVFPVDDLVLDRSEFDRSLADTARDAGARIYFGRRVSRIDTRNITIGADGPASFVRKMLNPGRKMDFLVGKQVIAEGDFEPDVFKVYVGSMVPDFFAWVVPENSNVARIGCASYNNTAMHFERLMKTLELKKKVSYQGGLIPVYDPGLRTQRGNIYIVGDAAGQVKATTGGGIVPGLACAGVLAGSIISGLSYEKEWKKTAGKELSTHLMIRKMLNRFNDRDYDRLAGILRSEKDAFSKYSRDEIKKLAPLLLFKHPSLLPLAMKLF